MQNNLTVSFKSKHTLTMQPSTSAPRYLRRRNGNACPPEELSGHIHCSIIHNNPRLETVQMSDDWRMEEQNVVYSYSAWFLSPTFSPFTHVIACIRSFFLRIAWCYSSFGYTTACLSVPLLMNTGVTSSSAILD